MTDRAPAATASPNARPRLGLSGKLLVLTVSFVMLAEVLIYVPSVANFRLNWLNDRLSAAYTAALVFETVPPDAVVPERSEEHTSELQSLRHLVCRLLLEKKKKKKHK